MKDSDKQWVDCLLDLRNFVQNEAFSYDPWVMSCRIVGRIDEMTKEIANG